MEDLKKWVTSSATGQRALLAAKTALAVGISWVLAPLMPGTVDEYPYYAPLGVLVSMYPTFMGSVRLGLQTLASVLIGIALATGVLLLGRPNILSISLAVGLGMLLAGLPRLGAGRDYVPVATLLVLIIGGQNADTFSLGYGVQMALGVFVGLAVNFTIFPPLKSDAARDRISLGRKVLLTQLEDAAKALVEHWPPEHEDWAGRQLEMDHVVVEIRRAVATAGESHRGNPRAYRRSRHKVVAQSFEDLAVLEKIAYHIRDLTEVLAATIWDGPLELRLGTELRQPLSLCLDATAGVLRAWEEGTAIPASLDRAGDILKAFNSAVSHGRGSEAEAFTAGAAIGLDLQRILAALRQGLCSGDESEPDS